MDQYIKPFQYTITKKAITVDYSAWTENIEMNHKALTFKFNGRVRITKFKVVIDSALKIIHENMKSKI